MSIAEFVSHLRNLDVRLSAEGQRLRLNAPKGVLTDSLRAQIAERKQELLQFLSDYEQPAAFIPPPILRRTTVRICAFVVRAGAAVVSGAAGARQSPFITSAALPASLAS